MHLRNSVSRYGSISQALHWLAAALVFVQLAIGLYGANLPVSLARLQWLTRHKSLGLAVLALVLLRFAWRSADPPPALPPSMPSHERRVALMTHRLLYAALIFAPLAGWLYASAAGLSVNWFGVMHIPDLVPRNPALAAIFKQTHRVLVALLALLLITHIGAALRHALLRRDGVMQRMLPWGARGEP